jgi:hypothetical protein
MRNFARVGEYEMMPLQLALQTQPQLWDENPYRTGFEGTPFRGMSDILLRYSRPELHEATADPDACIDSVDLVNYPAWKLLPQCHDLIFNLMRSFRAIALGRVIIARLPPGGVIRPHADNYGKYALQQGGKRFHACVYAQPGVLFHCGGETIQMRTGEVYWFRHTETHCAENNSADERVHLLIDMETG